MVDGYTNSVDQIKVGMCHRSLVTDVRCIKKSQGLYEPARVTQGERPFSKKVCENLLDFLLATLLLCNVKVRILIGQTIY